MPGTATVVLFGAGVGLVNGLLITRLRLQPFLVTLCGMFIFRGVARLMGDTVSFSRVTQAHPAFDAPLRSLRHGVEQRAPRLVRLGHARQPHLEDVSLDPGASPLPAI